MFLQFAHFLQCLTIFTMLKLLTILTIWQFGQFEYLFWQFLPFFTFWTAFAILGMFIFWFLIQTDTRLEPPRFPTYRHIQAFGQSIRYPGTISKVAGLFGNFSPNCWHPKQWKTLKRDDDTKQKNDNKFGGPNHQRNKKKIGALKSRFGTHLDEFSGHVSWPVSSQIKHT